MMEYKYLSWEKDTKTDDIMKRLQEYSLQGWEVVSHSHSQYGMSVILEKFQENNNKIEYQENNKCPCQKELQEFLKEKC